MRDLLLPNWQQTQHHPLYQLHKLRHRALATLNWYTLMWICIVCGLQTVVWLTLVETRANDAYLDGQFFIFLFFIISLPLTLILDAVVMFGAQKIPSAYSKEDKHHAYEVAYTLSRLKAWRLMVIMACLRLFPFVLLAIHLQVYHDTGGLEDYGAQFYFRQVNIGVLFLLCTFELFSRVHIFTLAGLHNFQKHDNIVSRILFGMGDILLLWIIYGVVAFIGVLMVDSIIAPAFLYDAGFLVDMSGEGCCPQLLPRFVAGFNIGLLMILVLHRQLHKLLFKNIHAPPATNITDLP